MKNKSITLLMLVAVLGISMAALGASTFSGDIMDNGCAGMGTHTAMEKMHHIPVSSALTGKDARRCTLLCVSAGGHFVLYNPSTKKIYNLNPESDARAYAGEHVTVTGALNGNTIQVTKISRRHL